MMIAQVSLTIHRKMQGDTIRPTMMCKLSRRPTVLRAISLKSETE